MEPKEKWAFGFRLRDLIWISVVLALLVAWRLEREQDVAVILQSNARITELHDKLQGYVEFYDDLGSERTALSKFERDGTSPRN